MLCKEGHQVLNLLLLSCGKEEEEEEVVVVVVVGRRRRPQATHRHVNSILPHAFSYSREGGGGTT
jgi:hypothetical protein